MSEQIDLHIFKAIAAASCVDIIVQAPKQRVQLNYHLTVVSASTIISTTQQ